MTSLLYARHLLALVWAVVGVSWCVHCSSAASWGYANKYAATIYQQDVMLPQTSSINQTVEFVYPIEDIEHAYTITAVHVDDMTVHGVSNAEVKLISGGVGHKHVVLRFQRDRTKAAYRSDVHFKLVIYGLDL